MSWPALKARLRLLFAPDAAESRMEEEIGFHIEMEADRLVREEGLDPREARRRALVSFGGVEKTKEELRESRGLAWLSGFRLDLKLGARTLVKHPVLTTASVLALSIAVAMAASWFEFMTDIVRPRLGLEDSDRIVQVRTRDVERATNITSSLQEFEAWRDGVGSFQVVAAVSPADYSMTTESGRFAPVEGMRVSDGFFEVPRVSPLHGRTLTAADIEAGATPTVVLGYSVWQRLFDGDPAAIGQTVRLGPDHATVVGVMPEGFAFPINEEVWTPLRENAVDYEPLGGPPVMVVGRLANGATLEELRTELSVVGERTAAQFPEAKRHLRPDANRFARGSNMNGPATLMNAPFLLFLIVVSANVATLFFARTVTREGEIAMRSALGASRRRILLQLVAEALVLTSLATVVGLAAAHWGLGWGMDLFWEVQQSRPPFWFDPGLSASSALYAAGLAVLGALIIGGIPGLRATRKDLRNRLPQTGAGGAGVRFGFMATGVIVVQVALCVAFIPISITRGHELLEEQRSSDFPAASYLSGQVKPTMVTARRSTAEDAGSDAERTEDLRRAERLDELQRRLAAEPGIVAATRVTRLPGFNHPMEAVQIESDTAATVWARQIGADPNFFETMEVRITDGRGLREIDATAEALPVAVVDGEWAAEVFGGRNPVGQRIRYPNRPDDEGLRWYEIVGVMAGMQRATGPGSPVAVVHPLMPRQRVGAQVYLRTAGPPEAVVPRLMELVSTVDPDLTMTGLEPLDEIWAPVERSAVFFAVALNVVAAIIVLFALIGIYALMSFTVAQRGREIGIRSALGADPRRIIVSIFSRAMAQIGLGIVVGGILVSALIFRNPEEIRMVAGVALAMAAVGLLACVLPARRALRIQPTEALRAE